MDSDAANGSPQNLIQDYLVSSREATTKEFDEANRDRLHDTMGSIGKVLSLQMILLAHGFEPSGTRFEACALIKTALDTLVSALHLARHRANIEVACLLRSALEAACTALHICRNESAYENFLEHSYHSTKSIHAAKQEIPVVGEIWGALSQVAVHITRSGHGPKIERDDSDGRLVMTIDINFKARSAGQPFEDAAVLTLISTCAEIVARTQELCLLDQDSARPGWRRAAGTSLMLSDFGNSSIDRYHREFLSLTERGKRA